MCKDLGWQNGELECLDTTEITIHDAGTRLSSFMYYSSAFNAYYMGRDMGWGVSNFLMMGYLHIYGSTVEAPNISNIFQYGNNATGNGGIESQNLTVGLIVESWSLFKSNAIFVSDSRIKTNIQDVNDDSALQKILAIQPKTYEYIDKYNKGNGTVYGFISQQIQEVVPEAVNLARDFIPNIYAILQCSGNIITTNEHTSKLKLNDEIKITLLDNTDKTFNIIDINENTITIDKSIEGDKCFLFGSKIDDFHTLDKNYIYTLNVSATQELYKLIQQQNQIIQDSKIDYQY